MHGVKAPLAAARSVHRSPRAGIARQWWLFASMAGFALGCGEQEPREQDMALPSDEQALQARDERRPGGGAPEEAVGLALEVDNGQGVPLRVRAGQRFYINQLDIRAAVASKAPEGVNTLRKASDFASLGWGGVKLADRETPLLPGATGYTHRRFYRDAAWMKVPSFFTVEPVDARGRLTGQPVLLSAGGNDKRRESDDFFVRRMRAIHATADCAQPHDCTGAKMFEEEALVELRNARTQARAKTFTLSPSTTALRLRWSLRPAAPYLIPVEQVAQPPYAYGFSMELEALTPPREDGTYAPGSDITFRLTLRDGEGKRLHPEGSLPTYNEVAFGANPPGIQYYRAFFDATTTYYRRKHRERMLMTQLIGPLHKLQPIRSIVDLEAFLGPDDVQTVGTPERDGVYAQFMTIPPANDLFGGAFDPAQAGWAAPVSDTWTYHLPENAEPGTYLVSVKGRRTYLGEDVPASQNVEIQVGTPERTSASLPTGNCNSCHKDGGELSQVLHGQANRAGCNACHAPLGFELEGPIFVRVHFIHSRSDRFDAPLHKCATCHLTQESTQRTSKAACLSCHKSYPKSHVEMFGPVESMYVGGNRESFQQCTGACHTTHPKSGF